MKKPYTFSSTIVVYGGVATWRFLGLPTKMAKEIKETYGKQARGWRSLPVTVTIGATTWDTSIFPDNKAGTYLLPLKASVRKAEAITDKDTVSCTISIR